MKLNIKAFALTSGLIWGLGLFCLTWWIIAFEGIAGEPTFIGRLYRGLFNNAPRQHHRPDLSLLRRRHRRSNLRLALQPAGR